MKTKGFNADNYVKEELTFNAAWENLFGFFILIITGLLFCIPFLTLWPENLQAAVNTGVGLQTRIITIGIIIAVLILGIITHEILHGIFYAAFCKNKFKSIKYGVVPKKGYAYCECKEVMRTNCLLWAY